MIGNLKNLLGSCQDEAAAVAATAPTDALPADVAVTIAGAHVIGRPGADDKSARQLITTARGAFFYGAEQPRAWLQSNWPDLTDVQRQHALGLIGSLVIAAKREQEAAAAAVRGGSRWANWQPIRSV
ncbi:hypothetical protein OR16_15304 [Cupriavidus basilensis OR16]|uniref:Uncharacterized protein n=1 Tax=Cupriavidus basilensis OR16 TaxID=1127483 RepID=H1S5E1_9BURK|nr:hypothetical protein [Cupriavidus basilensis]EHP42308.1 hypothetical protein OR16_15304 [Cupriavidus basilensis OR16]